MRMLLAAVVDRWISFDVFNRLMDVLYVLHATYPRFPSGVNAVPLGNNSSWADHNSQPIWVRDTLELQHYPLRHMYCI